MRRIEIFASFPGDVQKERSLAERLIRSIAAELNVPVSITYSNRLRALSSEERVPAGHVNGGENGTPLLCPCFWEYQDGSPGREYIPNTGQYDLVVCVLWSRLGIRLAPPFVMPGGTEPGSATDYEVAWALDQATLTPGFPALRIYRNRSIPAAPLEPKEEREKFLERWDSIQEFFANWEKEPGFSETCADYKDLAEFEELFRKHFRDFLEQKLENEFFTKGLPGIGWKSNPFRGLNFFDFEHAPVFHGRTKAVGEVLDALKKQAAAKKPFVLVLGPNGAGKSSLVRAGVLPILTQAGTADGDGPWRRAVTRPAAAGPGNDPFDSLAAALLDECALPKPPCAAVPKGWKKLAFELRNHPGQVAAQLCEELDHIGLQKLSHLLDDPEEGEGRREAVELARRKCLEPSKTKTQLVLVVDQLEELFVGEFSRELQRRYIGTLIALVRTRRVFVIATLRNDFYSSYQEFADLVELVGAAGRIDLQPPKRQELANMIRLPAEAAGLRFERDAATGRSLDETLLESAAASVEPLPILEHLLCRLYEKQCARKDGLLRWSDFRQIGELECALANHAESVFLTLKSDEQSAFDLVMRQMVTPEWSIKGAARPAAYRNLVASPGMNDRKKPGAKGLVDRFLREGLFCTSTDPSKEMLVSVTHETLLRRWPRLSRLASEDRDAVYLRNRLDKRLKIWLAQGQRTSDLLDAATGLAEAKSLLKDSRASLTESEIGYIEKSLAKQKRRRRTRNTAQLLAAGSLLLLAGGAARWWAEGLGPKKVDALPALTQTGGLEAMQSEGRVQFSENRADLIAGQLSALETELKKAEERAQLAEKNSDLAASQRSALETELQKAEERAQLAEKSAALALNGRGALENALLGAQEKAQVAQKNVDLATSQRNALEAELRKANEQAQLVQRITELFAAQPHSANDLPSTEQPAATDVKATPAAETHLADGSAQPTLTTPTPQKIPGVKQDQ